MNQNFNHSKEAYIKSQTYRYKEYWTDPNLGRPWTYLEEKFMRRFVAEQDRLVLSNFVWSEKFQMFWPEFIAKRVAAYLSKVGYLTIEPHKRGHEIYQLTNFGQCMVSKKRAYEM